IVEDEDGEKFYVLTATKEWNILSFLDFLREFPVYKGNDKKLNVSLQKYKKRFNSYYAKALKGDIGKITWHRLKKLVKLIPDETTKSPKRSPSSKENKLH